MHNLKLVFGLGGDVVFLLNSASPAVALALPKAHGPTVAGRWCPSMGLSPVSGRGQNSQGYGSFPEAGVTRLRKLGTTLAQGGSYMGDMHAHGKEMSLTNHIQVFPHHELKYTFFLSTELLN